MEITASYFVNFVCYVFVMNLLWGLKV